MSTEEARFFQRVRRGTLERVTSLSQAQLDYIPRPRRWSVGEIVDHLLRAEAYFRQQIVELVALARAGRRPYVRRSFAEYNPRFTFVPRAVLPLLTVPFSVGTFFFPQPLREAFARSRLVPLRNPDFAEPERGRRREALAGDLERQLADTLDLLAANADLDLRRLRFSHPFTGTVNALQLVRFMARHEERHQAQIAEVVDDAGFPADGRTTESTAGSSRPHAQQEVRFDGRSGRLHGVLHRADRQALGCVIFAHCFACTKDDVSAVAIAEALATAGIDVLRFDFAGLGRSEGDFAATSVAGDIADLHAAIEWMRSRGYSTPVLIGHSMGGAASLLAAVHRPDVPAVAVIATFAEREALGRLLQPSTTGHRGREAGSAAAGGPMVRIGDLDFVVTPAFWHELGGLGLSEAAARYRGPLLVLHGTDDRTIDIAQGERLFAAASQPKAFHALVGADHRLGRPGDAQRAAALLVPWLREVFTLSTSPSSER